MLPRVSAGRYETPVLSYGRGGVPKAIPGPAVREHVSPVLTYGPVSSPIQRAQAVAAVSPVIDERVLCTSPPKSPTHSPQNQQPAVLCYSPQGGSPNQSQQKGFCLLPEPAKAELDDEDFQNLVPVRA